MHRRGYHIVNAITLYRLIAAPFLFILIIYHQKEIFKWLLALSFLTDAIDGYLARRYGVISLLGSRLDSIADDLTIAAAITGIFILKSDFLKKELFFVVVLISLYVLQTVLALIRYKNISSFHTYTAKLAAILQAIFVILLFFLDEPIYFLFYVAASVTTITLIEEIILTFLLPRRQNDVKGLYWIIRKRYKD